MIFLKKLEPLTLLLLRCGLSLVFIYHGYPKLFGEKERIIDAFQAIGLPSFVVSLTLYVLRSSTFSVPTSSILVPLAA